MREGLGTNVTDVAWALETGEADARALAALDAEFNVVPAVMPTLDEIHAVFD